MSETCKLCGRTTDPNHAERAVEWCNGVDDPECSTIAAAYRCGILRGVELAKESARVLRHGRARDDGMPSSFSHEINWTDVDREAAKLAGENGE